MRKLLLILMACLLIMGTVMGCSGKNGTKKVTAQGIIDLLKEKQKDYITEVNVVTAENDESKTLGRPNQYIQKITWKDSRASDGVTVCSIEVFNNADDCKNREEYLNGIIKGMPMLTQYITRKGNVLLRIQGDLTPQQADEYKNVFNTIKL